MGAPLGRGTGQPGPNDRRITMMSPIASMPLSGPDPGKAADPATTAAPPPAPAAQRAERASRREAAGGVSAADLRQRVAESERVLDK